MAQTFEVVAGEVALLPVGGGAVRFSDLRTAPVAMNDPYVREAIGAWIPAIRRTLEATRAALVARQREPHDGYDVYPDCDGKVAVVRSTGTPLLSYDGRKNQKPEKAPARRTHGGSHGSSASSVHGGGVGAGCVQPYSHAILLSDPDEVPMLVREYGEYLVSEDIQGEVDIVVSGEPEPL